MNVCLPASLFLARRICLTALACVMVALRLPAQAPFPAAGPEAAVPAGTAAAEEDLRDPFWPVGFTAPVRVVAVAAGDAEWRLAEKALVVKGVTSLGGTPQQPVCAAFINGRWVETGQVVSVKLNGRVFNWTVARITLAGGPVFERIQTAPPPGRKAAP